MRRFIRGLVILPMLVGGVHARDAAPTGTPTPAQPILAPSQAPSPPSSSSPEKQPPGAVFRTEVNYIEVDALVTDERGDVVRGLTRDDFQLFEERIRQEITTFTEVAVPTKRVEPTLVERTPLPRDIATNEEGLDGRIYAIVLDEAHTDVRRSALVRKAASEFIERHMAANDIAAVVYTGGRTESAQAFTSNKRLLQESVNRFTGRKARSATPERMRTIDQQKDMLQPTRDPTEQAPVPRFGVDTDPWDSVRAHDARASMATLESVAKSLHDVHGRRKAILFFSEGIDYDTLDVMGKVQRSASDVLSSMRNAIATATWNNVALDTIDPRGLATASGLDIEMTAPPQDRGFGIDSQSLDRELRRSQDSLRTLAEQTGGVAAVDTNDLATAFDRIVRANTHFYLLGYYPTDFRPDGKFRRLEVRVTRPGVSVVARNGYVRPRLDEDKETRPETSAATGTSSEVRELLDSPWPRPGLTLGVTAAAFKVSAKTATVAVTIEIPGRALPFAREDDQAVNEVEVSLMVVDHAGRVHGGDRVLVQPRLSAETHEVVQRRGMRFVRRLELPPGRYQLRVAAREAEEGRRGSVFYDLQVPDYGDDQLVMSDVLLTSRTAALTLTPSIDDVVKGVLETPPTAARTFTSDDILTAYAEVYGALKPAHDTAVTTRVTSADGREVFRATDERAFSERQTTGSGLRHKVAIPLAGVSPGTYLLRIEAKATVGEHTAARQLSFEVLPNPARPDIARFPASPPAGPTGQWSIPRPASRIARLETWLAAVEQHEPGTPDGPALMVRTWAPADLGELAADLAMVVKLIGDPSHPVQWVVDPTRPGRPQRSGYSMDDEQRLRAVARDVVQRRGQDHKPEGAATHGAASESCAQNRILKRGAVLHTDAAIRFGDVAAQPGAGSGLRPDQWRVRFSDGQQSGTEVDPGHWELAHALLDNVIPNPAEDDTVRLWYIATSAHGQYHERHTRHEDRAAQLFPRDPDVLFLAASLHETFASPRIQRLVRSIRLPASTKHDIGSERSELRKAEELFRRALKLKPAFTEARIRLGRVLHLLGRHEQAARELQQAVTALSSGGSTAADDEGLLVYYAEMFLGAAAEALGRLDLARASYARAAALYTGAPSPRLALSRLALRDRAATLDTVRLALRPHPGDQARDDPWWRYHVVQGRGVDTWFGALHRSLMVGP
jgi:VWFA-related protein